MTEPTPQDQLAGLITGFWVSQMVFATAKLGIAGRLADGPKTADELANATGTHPGALYRFLRALASNGIFSEGEGEGEGDQFSLTPLAELLRSDVPGSQRATVLMMVGQFYDAWVGLLVID